MLAEVRPDVPLEESLAPNVDDLLNSKARWLSCLKFDFCPCKMIVKFRRQQHVPFQEAEAKRRPTACFSSEASVRAGTKLLQTSTIICTTKCFLELCYRKRNRQHTTV